MLLQQKYVLLQAEDCQTLNITKMKEEEEEKELLSSLGIGVGTEEEKPAPVLDEE